MFYFGDILIGRGVGGEALEINRDLKMLNGELRKDHFISERKKWE